MRDLDETAPEQPLLSTHEISEPDRKSTKRLHLLLGGSFFLFGLMNNVLYVIILSAALDLVPPSTPKGIIAFCNIAPALVAKVGWPYFLKGKIRYTKRLLSCCALSVSGMLIVAAFETLSARLMGIAFASFASGLGELTFLQLSTAYHPRSAAGHCVGYFASGTGAAGLVGAGLWWEVRGLGVRLGVGLSAILPFTIPLTYFLVLPPPNDYTSVVGSGVNWSNTVSEYTAIPEDETDSPDVRAVGVAVAITPLPGLTSADKCRLVRPLLLKYMLPLFCVYTFEYTINQGISPTLLYPVPLMKDHPVLGSIVKSTRDYYPLWQLIYQAFVFLSRSSISLGIPALPAGLLPVPAIVQGFIMSFLAVEATTGFLSGGQPESTTQGSVLPILMLLIATEGICGGLAYVNVFYRVGQDSAGVFDQGDLISQEKLRQEQEFRIGSIGFADSSAMGFIPVHDQNKASYGISTGLKYACHVPMACGTASQFSKNIYQSPDANSSGVQDIVEIVTPDDLDDAKSCHSGVSSFLQTRLNLREQGGWHSTPNLLSLQTSPTSRPPSRSQSPAPGPAKRQPAGPHGSEFRATSLRNCWSPSKTRQMSITRLEWYESEDGVNHFLLMQLVSAPTASNKDIWMRLERRSKHSSLRSLAGQAKSLVGRLLSDDAITVSSNKSDLMGSGNASLFFLKEIIEEPIPLSFMLDVLNLAHKNLASNINDSWMYASFVMDAVHQFCEPTTPLSDTSSVQSNNPHRILRNLADHRTSADLKLQHDWEILDFE